ncbi:MAG: S8 family serine peptidase [Prevotella sp.]|nr:S8 family serine peptidase [Prevotella sp.]
MKRLFTTAVALMVCMVIAAQSKLTTSAMLRIAKEQAKASSAARGHDHMSGTQTDGQRVRLVVKTDGAQDAATFASLREAGAEVQARLGKQAVVSVPVDRVHDVEAIDGIVRIDVGHKPQYKTDVTRRETNVSLLNGPEATHPETTFTGKGVTVCLIDGGFDFQHPAFKDSQGHSRIKCVYMMGDNNGRKFTVNDTEAGEYTFPGSVYDTPELIAQLTTDDPTEYHGTHTAGIAAGSLSPMGFGGMAPEADIVLIPLNEVEVEGFDEDTEAEEYVELALAFVGAYARQSDQPLVLSASMNNHMGPHNGTGTVPEAIADLSAYCIPVMSAGNEGGYPIYLHRQLKNATSSVKGLLMPYDESDNRYLYESGVYGYTRTGTTVGVQLNIFNMFANRVVWSSEVLKATPSCEETIKLISSEDNENLAKYFDGEMGLGVGSLENGRLKFEAFIDGSVSASGYDFFQLVITGSAGTEFDAWESLAGFYSMKGSDLGNSEMSGGDWTSTPNVISVGAYCANTDYRSYDGTPKETEDEEEGYTLGDYAWFSSYGTMFNGVEQPTVTAPGVNIVSSVSSYTVDADAMLDNMQWQGHPYSSEDGTSMSCPAAAGIVALWLQARPDLTLADVKKVLEETSRNDSFTLDSPQRFGYGKIDAQRGIEFLKNLTGIHEIQNVGRQNDGNFYDLQGRCVGNRPVNSGLYIRGNRKMYVNTHR